MLVCIGTRLGPGGVGGHLGGTWLRWGTGKGPTCWCPPAPCLAASDSPRCLKGVVSVAGLCESDPPARSQPCSLSL